jgi:predicted DNA-binding transcriptional regulator YafY
MKILYLARIFTEETDENHPVTIADITARLAQFGISAERKSLYSDIEGLISFGMDIVTVRGQHNSYYLGSRLFELPELKLLADAVCSAQFLTEKKSKNLLKKIESLAGVNDGNIIHRQVYVADRVKSMNERIYINVDTIHNAINEKKQISFRYFDYGLDKKPVYREGERIASPYAMTWDDEKYYLIAYYTKYPDSYTNFRVDRMSDIKILDEKREKAPSGLNLSEYLGSTFSMFSGSDTEAVLEFDNSLINAVIDRFGVKTKISPAGDDRFAVTVHIKATAPFFGWLFQFGDKASIQGPPELKKQYKKMLRSVLKSENKS